MDDNTKNAIQNHIDNNEVCLFMKGTPDAPQCGFSMAISNMLKILEVKFVRVPKFEEVPYPVIMEPNLVIEYYSR